jgi:hypothetical protein
VYREIPNFIREEDTVILNGEIAHKVLVISCIVSKKNPITKFINLNKKPAIIKNHNIFAIPLSKFEIQPNDKNSTEFNSHNPDRVKKLIDLITPNIDKLPDNIPQKLKDLITKYADVFTLKGEKLTSCNFYKTKLKLKDSTPVYIRKLKPIRKECAIVFQKPLKFKS